MLWYKAWLETRWRVLVAAGMILFALFQTNPGDLAGGHYAYSRGSAIFSLLVPLIFGGSGIRTEAPFRMVKGSSGSVAFTLALPVSRMRIFLSRVAFGALGLTLFISVMFTIAGIAFPAVSSQVTLADGLMYASTILFCGFAIFGISTFFATFMDQQWQIMATMGTCALLLYLAPAKSVFNAMGAGSPLVTHAMPWTQIGISMGAAAVFLAAAAVVVEKREY